MKEAKSNRFNYLFKLYRETLGLDYEDLAKAIGYTPLHLCYVEMGRRKPDKILVEALINFYGLEMNGKREFYDAAADALGDLPFDVIDYLNDNPDELENIKKEIALKELSSNSR